VPPRSRKSAGKIGGGLAGLTVFRDGSTVSGYGAPLDVLKVTETVTASVHVMSTRSVYTGSSSNCRPIFSVKFAFETALKVAV